MRLTVLPAALADLEAIGDHIAADNPSRALTFVAEIEARIGRIPDAPGASTPRDDLHPGLRSVRHGRYGIYFLVLDQEIRVVRVLHGARDLPRVLRP